ncbi:MAG: hypothetical protein GWP08_13900 [Nitrospiraceae bacterium]|nr:hypothetical protein [Nitrospiraceae bacterium]
MLTDQKQYQAMLNTRSGYGIMTGPESLERMATELPRDGRFDDGIKCKTPLPEDRLRRHVKHKARPR